MPNVFQRIGGAAIRMATGAGNLVRSFRKGAPTRRRRPRFFSGWAREGTWNAESFMQDDARRRALGNSWFYAGVKTLITEMTKANFHVQIKRATDEDPVDVRNHPLEAIMRRPNPWMGQAFFTEYVTWWLMLAGQCPLFIMLDAAGRPKELWPLPGGAVDPVPGDSERFIHAYEYTVSGQVHVIPAELIVHLKFANPFDIFRGMSPLIALMMPVDSDSSQAHWNLNFFGPSNTMPNALISLSAKENREPLDDTSADALLMDLRNDYGAFQRKTLVVTDVDVQTELLGYNHQEMSFTEGRRLSKEEILNGLGLHPGMFDPSATEANAKVGERKTRDTANAILVLAAEQITAELVWRYYGPELRGVYDDISLTDRAMELLEINAAAGALTMNEVRGKYWDLSEYRDQAGNLDPRGFEPFRDTGGAIEMGGFLVSPNPAAEQELARADLRKWRQKSLAAVKRGESAAVRFASRWIPAEMAAGVTALLESTTGAEGVKTLFHKAVELSKEDAPSHEPQKVMQECPLCGHDTVLLYQGHKGLMVCEGCGKTFDPEVWATQLEG